MGTVFSEKTYDTIDSFRQSDRGHLLFGVNGAKAQEFRQVDVAQQVQGMGRPLNHHPIPGKTIRDDLSDLGSSRIFFWRNPNRNEVFFGMFKPPAVVLFKKANYVSYGEIMGTYVYVVYLPSGELTVCY